MSSSSPPDSATELNLLSAGELTAAYRCGKVSPVEATQAALDAIAACDDAVNAFVTVDPDAALEAARASERRWRSGTPIGRADGVPTTIKDILLTRGWPTLRGSTLIADRGRWAEDAPAVARLREAGAVLLGKTTTPEFAWKAVTDSPRYGPTRNPWDPGLTPGGSSGGSGAAVALGMGTWSVGTDGGGSVRIPGAFTGTVAFKPTYGLIPLYPASPFGTLSHAGPMTRSVADAAVLLDILTGFDDRDWSALPPPAGSFTTGLDDGVTGLRMAYSPTLGYGSNDPEVASLVDRAVGSLADAGAVVEEADPGFADPVEAFHVLWFSAVAKVLQPYGPEQRSAVDPGLRRAGEAGESATASDYLDATAERMSLGQRMGAFHRRHHLLLTPTTPIPAFPVGQDTPDGWPSPWWSSWTPYTYPFNMTQQPALTVPCGFTDGGLPVGLQIVGPRHSDALVLRTGRAYEMRTGWHRARPPQLSPTKGST